MVDIQSATSENRRGKRYKDRKIEEETTGQNIMACPISYGGHNKQSYDSAATNQMVAAKVRQTVAQRFSLRQPHVFV